MPHRQFFGEGLKATWIGHASFMVETSKAEGRERGLRILFDPVFSERVGPYGLVGPKRFSPTPCRVEELPEVDIVAISHTHYDHLDIETIRHVWRANKGRVHFVCGLNVKSWFLGLGMEDHEVSELDWWDGVAIEAENVGSVRLTCAPSQHFSGRTLWDLGHGLWCSYVVEEQQVEKPKKLYFSGDTGYRTITPDDDISNLDKLPHCPAFAEIGETYGPFDLALLPIGCYSPRTFMSNVHCAPEDSIGIHKDIRSKKSIGMHYGTIRGGLSAYYEDVREPAQRWKEHAEKAGLRWGEEVGLCDLGETVVV